MTERLEQERLRLPNLGPETARSHLERIRSGFYERYMAGNGLDIGYMGSSKTETYPVFSTATGIDKDYGGYDGRILPFDSQTQDYVFSSHCLEHIEDYKTVLQEWFRVVKPGGYIVITVPHQHLYERRTILPSKWNADHKRFYTPSTLLSEVEESLEVNTYRIRYLADNDKGYDYNIPEDKHAVGAYEIELVIERIK